MMFSKPDDVVVEMPHKYEGIQPSKVFQWYKHRSIDTLLEDHTRFSSGYNVRSSPMMALFSAFEKGAVFSYPRVPANAVDVAVIVNTFHDAAKAASLH